MSEYGKIHTDGSRSGGQPLADSIEAKAQALLMEVRIDRGAHPMPDEPLNRAYIAHEALCRAIEQHEAFKQEVSDALVEYFGEHLVAEDGGDALASFIIPKPKPKSKSDALVEALVATDDLDYEPQAEAIRAALGKLGFEIREKGQ